MRLNRIELSNFGKLSGAFNFEPQRCNVLCAANEFGKSTLVDAILFSLYPPPKLGPRDALKPMERYQPWSDGRERPLLRLELTLAPDRRYRIEALLGKKPEYLLVDLDTNRKSPIPNNSFGEDKLQLSFKACLQSFLLRQEPTPTTDGDTHDLQTVIERAVSTAASQEGVSVQEALRRLDCVTVSYQDKQIKLETAIDRLEKEIRELERRRQQCDEERDRQQGLLRQLELTRTEIERLEKRVIELEFARDKARLAELENELRQQAKRKKDHAEKFQKKEQLRPYARYTEESFAELQKLWGELKTRREQLKKKQADLHRLVKEPLSDVERALADYPATIEKLNEADAGRLTKLLLAVEGQIREIEELERRIREGEATLRRQGVDVEQVLSLEERISHLESEELALLFGGHQREQLELERAQQEILLKRGQAQQQCSEAEKKIASLRTFSAVWFFLALLSGAGFIAGLLYGLNPVAYGSLAAAAVCVLTAMWFAWRARRIVENLLRSAQEAAASAESRANELRNRLDDLNQKFERIRKKAALSSGDLLGLEVYAQVNRTVATIVEDRKHLARQRELWAENLAQALEIIRHVDPEISDSPSLKELQECERKLDLFLQQRQVRDRLREDDDRRRREIAEEEKALESIEARLLDILNEAGTPDGKIETRIETYQQNLRSAKRYRELEAELKTFQIWSEEEEKQRIEEKQQIEQRIRPLAEAHPHLLELTELCARKRTALETELALARRELEEKRAEHEKLILACDRVIEKYRTEVPAIEVERAQKQEALQQLQRMAEALALARRLIAELNQEVSRSWQRELKMKLEELMPRLLPHYVEPGVLENLELTLRDGKTGKVFQGSKELGYLSRGTRDQLDFILRVAIGEILTTHCGPLPLILDEPFAHWDDERFVQGVRFLTDLAERRQVIVLTCHSWRFDRLREEYPGIYAQLAFVEIG
ncbi:MAG: hypothetical protein ACP5QZ_04640 [Candidatus Sumerlaeaceae bacterium]